MKPSGPNYFHCLKLFSLSVLVRFCNPCPANNSTIWICLFHCGRSLKMTKHLVKVTSCIRDVNGAILFSSRRSLDSAPSCNGLGGPMYSVITYVQNWYVIWVCIYNADYYAVLELGMGQGKLGRDVLKTSTRTGLLRGMAQWMSVIQRHETRLDKN